MKLIFMAHAMFKVLVELVYIMYIIESNSVQKLSN